MARTLMERAFPASKAHICALCLCIIKPYDGFEDDAQQDSMIVRLLRGRRRWAHYICAEIEENSNAKDIPSTQIYLALAE